jgi:hypothetical protein
MIDNQAVLTGRPSTYSLHFIDCQLSQEGLTVVSNGTAAKSGQLGFAPITDSTDHRTDNLKSRFMFSVSVVTDVGTELLPARPTAFTRVMEVDRQIRQSEPTPLTTPPVALGSPVHWLTTQPVSDIGTLIHSVSPHYLTVTSLNRRICLPTSSHLRADPGWAD